MTKATLSLFLRKRGNWERKIYDSLTVANNTLFMLAPI